MKKTYYAYKITDKTTNEFYYGSRSCFGKAIDDTEYMGSMKTWNPDKSNLIKEIIRDDFESRDELMIFENNIIQENINNSLNRNYHIPNVGFHKDGSSGMLYKNKKILLEKAEEAGVEVKSKWGIEEQHTIQKILNGELIKPASNEKTHLNEKTGLRISYFKTS